MTQNDVYHKINDVMNVPVYSRLKHDYINFILQATCGSLLKLAAKILSKTYKDMTLYLHMYQNVHAICFRKLSVYGNCLCIRSCDSRNIVSVSLCLVPF